MTSPPDELLKDPLFQLNAVLWLSQPLPEDHEITPLFHRQGFVVYAIAPLLPLPLDLQLESRRVGVMMQAGARPDVVLTAVSEDKFAFIECKASSFSINSTNSEQARTHLIIAGPRSAEILGLPARQALTSLLSYFIPESDHAPMDQTITSLQTELTNNRLPAGQATVVGLQMRDTDVSIVINGRGSEFFGLPTGPHPFLQREPETDPRPLYFIPYDPDLCGQLSEAEKNICKRVLFEKMQSTIIAAVGRANPPIEVSLESQSILNDAMCGMYEQWENDDSARHMRKLCRQFMEALMRTTNSVVQGAMVFRPGEGWRVTLQNQEQYDKVIDALTRFTCETLDLRIEPTLDLFDGLENDGVARTDT